MGNCKAMGGKRRLQLRESVDRHIVVPFDIEMAECWARISESRKKGGRPIATSDCWIAATAARHELELVTHNGRDFAGIEGLVVHSR